MRNSYRKNSFKINITSSTGITLVENKVAYKIKCNILKKVLRHRLEFILSLISEKEGEVSIKFCGLEEMRSVNASFRHKDYPTDVLSFTYDTDKSYFGDILVCIPVCIIQSKEHKTTVNQELEKMIIHGLIHLRGFDHDRSESAYKVMTKLESLLAKELKLEHGKPNWFVYKIDYGEKN